MKLDDEYGPAQFVVHSLMLIAFIVLTAMVWMIFS